MDDEQKTDISPGRKAQRTARWARTMTKWLISWSNKRGVKWQLVEFGGTTGSESYGIVDILAIRKNHKELNTTGKRGDFFEIVLIQVKGGSSRLPSESDKERLRQVADHHKAKAVVLAEWKKKETLKLYILEEQNWVPVNPMEIFG